MTAMTAYPRESIVSVRALAEQAFSRAAGAPLVPGNRSRLLEDARENYPAWLDGSRARRCIHFESYIIHDDTEGEHFSDALIAKARDGVHVRVVYDWVGGSARRRAGSGGDCGRAASRCAATTRRTRAVRSVGSAAITER